VNAHDDFRVLIEGYALGALDADERTAFETHVVNCRECSRALDEALTVVSRLAYLAPVAEPSTKVQDRLLQQVKADAVAQSQAPGAKSAVPWWLWAGVAALLVFSIYSGWEARRLQKTIQQLNEQTAAERQRHEALEKEFLAAQMQARILTDPRSKKIMLAAKDPKMPQLEAMWNPEFGLCLMGHGVPMPAQKRAFELWLIPKAKDSKPMPVHSMMWPDSSGKLMHVIAQLPESMNATKAIAVTEEPASGSPEPTSEPMWVGTVS
jgi:anti-sigma-K factor RskA